MAINKVIYGGRTIMDISDEQLNNVTAENILIGHGTFDKNGEHIDGTCDYNCNTHDDNVNDISVLDGVIYHTPQGNQSTGTMPNNDVQTITIDAEQYASTTIPIEYGYSAPNSSVVITNIESNEIAEGVTLFGIVGSHHSGTIEYDTEHNYAVPLTTQQTVSPETGKVFANVTVYAIPYREVQTAGTSGYTADIAYLG